MLLASRHQANRLAGRFNGVEFAFRDQQRECLVSTVNGLAATLPIRAFNRIFTRRCRIASLISGCSERFYLDMSFTSVQFALLELIFRS